MSRSHLEKSDPALRWRPSRRDASLATLAVVALVALPYLLPQQAMVMLPTVAAMFIAVMGMNILVGNTGQVSFGHSGFMAIGAYTGAIAGSHVDGGSLAGWLLSLVAGVLAAGVCGILVGVLAARLSGFYLVLLTLVFAMTVEELVVFADGLTGGSDGIPYPGPGWLFEAALAYWVILGIALACAAVVGILSHGRTGRNWSAVRDSPDGATAASVNVGATRAWAFVLSTALAGLAGALGASYVGVVSADTYNVWLSAYLIVAVVAGGVSSVAGSLLGAALVVFLPVWADQSGVSADIVFGAGLVLVLLFMPHGLAGIPRQLVRLARRPRRATLTERRTDVASAALREKAPAGSTPILELRGVDVRYGGLLAAQGIDLHISPGETVALLGANGAGKTTLLRAACGWVRADRGHVLLDGADLSGLPVHKIARSGLAHVPEGRGIFPDLTVEENLRVAALPHAHRPKDSDFAAAYQAFPKLAVRRKQVAGTMSGGEQQMLAVGRALVAQPRLIMLDEPSLGLAPRIVEEMYEAFEGIRTTGVSILLVEQTVHQALQLADRGYVMSGGQIIASGTADTLGRDDELVRLYLRGAVR